MAQLCASKSRSSSTKGFYREHSNQVWRLQSAFVFKALFLYTRIGPCALFAKKNAKIALFGRTKFNGKLHFYSGQLIYSQPRLFLRNTWIFAKFLRNVQQIKDLTHKISKIVEKLLQNDRKGSNCTQSENDRK